MEIKFDPFIDKEVDLVLEIIKLNKPETYKSSLIEMNSQKIDDLIEQNNDLKKMNEKLNDDLNNSITEKKTKDNEIEEIMKKLSDLEKLDSERQDEMRKMNESHKKEIDAKDDEYRRLQRDLGNENLSLKKKITELQKRLDAYEPNIGGEMGEVKLYNVEGSILVETISKEAYYQARTGSDNEVIFQYNYESGPSKEACKNRTSMLEPFCEIIEEVPNANAIQPGTWGVATPMRSGNLMVKKKAQIKLIRN